MVRYIIRRLLLSIPVLFGVVLIVFVLARVIPGDPCTAALGEHANPASCARSTRDSASWNRSPSSSRSTSGASLQSTSGTPSSSDDR